jgi:hypothetical protein
LRQQIGIFDLQLVGHSAGQISRSRLSHCLSRRPSFNTSFGQDPMSGFNQLMLVLLDGQIGAALTKAEDRGNSLQSYRSAVEVAGNLSRNEWR